jgi:putative copper resistance protein D
LIWLLRDFDLLSVILRAFTLAFEILTLGGVCFLLLAVIPAATTPSVQQECWRSIRWAAIGLAISEVCYVATDSAILMGSSPMSFGELVSASFFLAGSVAMLSGCAIAVCAFVGNRRAAWFSILPSVALLLAAVAVSHSFSRLDHRAILVAFTAAHHVGSALWIGAMPFLLLAMKSVEAKDGNDREAKLLLQRFSPMALAGAGILLLGGFGMAWFYLGLRDKSLSGLYGGGLYGTSYGVLLLAKVFLFLAVAALGAGNFFVVRRIAIAPRWLLMRLRRFGEAEIGLAFTAILAAASMTSQPPAVDMRQDWVPASQIVARLRPVLPVLTSPPLVALKRPSSLAEGLKQSAFTGATAESDANDRAWSEYNHHWAGLIVLAAGLFASISRLPAMRWARNWPVVFAGLAAFILLRADPECWPLGPRPFWASFSYPDVLEHRVYALLILGFAGFEWGVQTGRLHTRWMALVFPVLCALGGALLLTHNHGIGNASDELLAEISHTAIAVLGVAAGWSRWLELRLPDLRKVKWAAYTWPLCLVLVGFVLLNYRES